MVARSEAIYCVTDGFDHARIFVAWNQRKIRRVKAMQNVRVGAANARGGHTDQ